MQVLATFVYDRTTFKDDILNLLKEGISKEQIRQRFELEFNEIFGK